LLCRESQAGVLAESIARADELQKHIAADLRW
jgi:hypothetical protein